MWKNPPTKTPFPSAPAVQSRPRPHPPHRTLRDNWKGDRRHGLDIFHIYQDVLEQSVCFFSRVSPMKIIRIFSWKIPSLQNLLEDGVFFFGQNSFLQPPFFLAKAVWNFNTTTQSPKLRRHVRNLVTNARTPIPPATGRHEHNPPIPWCAAVTGYART